MKTAFGANSKLLLKNRQSIGGNTADLQANTSTQLLKGLAKLAYGVL
jgi:hypothetical protein